jgi:antitoxin HicB
MIEKRIRGAKAMAETHSLFFTALSAVNYLTPRALPLDRLHRLGEHGRCDGSFLRVWTVGRTAPREFFMSTRYTVSDGKVVLTLEAAEEGGYVVTSPLDPELITQAETIEEAFANARDAAQALKQARMKLVRHLSAAKTLK